MLRGHCLADEHLHLVIDGGNLATGNIALLDDAAQFGINVAEVFVGCNPDVCSGFLVPSAPAREVNAWRFPSI
jgi:hypothetical protein